MSYVDLHLHLLPGLDDGSRDLQDALRHARRLAREGVHDVVVTPHVGHPWFAVDVESLPARTAALQRSIDAEGIPLRLRTGGEIHPAGAPHLSPRELDLIAQGPPGSRWVLLEVPFEGIDDGFLAAGETIRSRGHGLLIAHPERARGLLSGGLSALRALLRQGAVLQVNVCSLLGHHGPEALEAGAYLLRTRLAYVLASDGHPGMREHTLRLGFDLAQSVGVSSVQAWQLTQANPRLLLDHGLPALTVLGGHSAWRDPHAARVDAARHAARA